MDCVLRYVCLNFLAYFLWQAHKIYRGDHILYYLCNGLAKTMGFLLDAYVYDSKKVLLGFYHHLLCIFYFKLSFRYIIIYYSINKYIFFAD